jgi:hypothetical protein
MGENFERLPPHFEVDPAEASHPDAAQVEEMNWDEPSTEQADEIDATDSAWMPAAIVERNANLRELEDTMLKAREAFARQYTTNLVREVLEHFKEEFSESLNGTEVKQLFQRTLEDKTNAGMAEFIKTGNDAAIPALRIRLKSVDVPERHGKMLVGCRISSEGGPSKQIGINVSPSEVDS